ncbi:GNAT family N-acetyltransferase [Streptomyces sp. NPDC006798]|uniref:GNAT family N-acetyltransferase n=1 Tax=Streptomyces sp. NPDC006798 TaxID=3155462 RepID=UPI0033F72448
MPSDQWHLTEDLDGFLTGAGDFLRSRPDVHLMPLTVIARLRAGTYTLAPGQSVLYGRLESGGEVRGVCYRLPGRGLGITPLTPGQADGLAGRLADLGLDLPYVSCDRDTAVAFAAAWRRRTGATASLRVELRLHRLGTLTPPDPLPAGRGRGAGDADLGRVVDWCRGFAEDVGEPVTITTDTWPDTRFADKTYTFWETPDGTPVSIAGANPPVAGVVQIDPVYTPAHLRGHGYAAAATAAACETARAEGATGLVLFTDAANPTSNALYHRLGFRVLDEWAVYDFTAAAPDPDPSTPDSVTATA